MAELAQGASVTKVATQSSLRNTKDFLCLSKISWKGNYEKKQIFMFNKAGFYLFSQAASRFVKSVLEESPDPGLAGYRM